jgi:hypothetical protein
MANWDGDQNLLAIFSQAKKFNFFFTLETKFRSLDYDQSLDRSIKICGHWDGD